MKATIRIHKAIKYAVRGKALPEEVRVYFLQAFGCVRKVQNLYVDLLYRQLEKRGYTGGDLPEDLSFPEVTFWKQKFAYLKETDSLALANAKIAFQNAVKNYAEEFDHSSYTRKAQHRAKAGTKPLSFRDLKGMPKFRSRAKGDFSYTTNCQYTPKGRPSIRLEGNLLYLPKIKTGIPLRIHRSLPEGARVKNATVSMEPDGSLFVSLGYEQEKEIDLSLSEAVHTGNTEYLSNRKILGLDYSQPFFYVDSDGRKANCPPHAYRKQEGKLARIQRKMSRMSHGSHNWEKQKRRLDQVHGKIRNKRKDYAHKLSRQLADQYDVVVVEDLNLRAMGSSLKLGKNLHDNGFGMFRTFLSYKLEEKGSLLVKVPWNFPSTKRCSDCGYVNPEITLQDREWVCPICGEYHDRDENAAVNILGEGRRILAEYYRDWEKERSRSNKRAEALRAGRKKKKSPQAEKAAD